MIVLTVPRQPLRTNKIAKIWSRSWEPSSQLSVIMPIIPRRPISPHVSRVFRRRSCRFFLSSRLTSFFGAMNYQINAIKLKSNRSLASLIAAGSADAGDIAVAYSVLSYLFDAFLVSCTHDIFILCHLYSSLEYVVEQPSSSKTCSI